MAPAITLDELQTLFDGPTLITLTGKDLPIDDVVNTFYSTANLSHGKINWFGLPDTPKTLTVDWKEVPFWTAARELEKLTGLRWG